ncbi:exodeoxyribonuclease V subunit beta [Alteromonas gilva]|uniref:RecBCD enzyme subunit RecB n=1 Tax=Alteromonas gilva TaxID=2987522 RepID=A0ABT5L2U0_9ALTE|nr:exodeoxyribonuclease V subunit beta [Alteromonas gilva]MDC8830721.1 exodeoxyribonuclease V subunit beta [Alteromonas gilva]
MTAQHLDVIQIPLRGRHLIEASAGTGKTFNITRIYLRCLLERQLSVQQILVMTFTKAATEEIRGRIAATLRDALHYWQQRAANQSPAQPDPVLDAIYQRVAPQQALALLQAALLELDDAAVFTIHSFCNKVLADMAFTSAAPLELSLATDTRALYLQGCEDFMRKISRDSDAFAQLVDNKWHTPERFMAQFKTLLEFSGRPVIPETEQIEYEYAEALAQLDEQFRPHTTKLLHELVSNEALFQSAVIGNDKAREQEWQVMLDWLQNGPLADTPPEVAKFVHGNRYRAKREGVEEAKAIVEAFKPFRKALDKAVKGLSKSRQTLLDKVPVYTLVADGVEYVQAHVKKQKQQLNTVDFNDLIRMLASQISGPDAPLCEQLRGQYPVALVDEFQDTDADQYHILANVYPPAGQTPSELENTDAVQPINADATPTLMMIGDPKQAIYGFRGGDIFTYLQAARQAEYRWVMDTNWRSVAPLVSAYNRLFWGAELSQPARDLFDFDIRYEPVNASDGAKAAATPLTDPAGDRCALTFLCDSPLPQDSDNKGATRQRLARLLSLEIVRLLAEAKLGDNPVRPADIAILVQTGSEAKVIQQALNEAGLPAVYLSNRNSLFASNEAGDLLLVLNAIWHSHDLRLVNGIIGSPLLGLNPAQIQAMLVDDNASDWDTLLMQIARWRDIWLRRGIMSLVLGLLQNHYLPTRGEAERSLTNYQHLAELLQETAKTYPQPGHLLNWLHRQVQAPEQAEEHIQRLESDARLIQIVTQHGSKGLEYPIVFVPFAGEYRDPVKFGNRQAEVLRFYDEHAGMQQMALGATPATVAQVTREGDAESMRLLYVAITRASHRCYLGTAEGKQTEQSSLGRLVRRPDFDSWQQAIAHFAEQPFTHAALIEDVKPVDYHGNNDEAEPLTYLPFARKFDDNWRLYSFSALSRQAAHTQYRQREAEVPVETTLPAELAQQQLRYQLKAGAQSGNLLHDLLEVTDFTAPDWQESGVQVAKRYGIDASQHEALFSWLDEVLATPMALYDNSMLQLNQLPSGDTLREAEFYFPLQQVNRAALVTILREHRLSMGHDALSPALEGAAIDGMMHGFIDLIFTAHGRYYVADYKSTFLGLSPEDYDPDALNHNNQQHYYDLQYLIYSVALHRFLAQRIDDYDPTQHFGGVAYFYLRGMAPGHPPQSGVFYHPLSVTLLTDMERALTGNVTRCTSTDSIGDESCSVGEDQ